MLIESWKGMMIISANKKLIVCCLLLLPLDGEVMKILEIEMKTKFETEMHNTWCKSCADTQNILLNITEYCSYKMYS